MTNRYADLRQKLKRPLFVPFTVVGDPDTGTSLKIIQALIKNGADALELGLPFSDPPADGPVIQAAHTRALAAGVTIDQCFTVLKSVRAETAMPIGLLVYFNTVLQRGIDRFYTDCQAAGVDSVLVADLPLEHADEVLGAARKHQVAPVLLVSDRTTDERLKAIAKVANGYLYLTAYTGVTGKTKGVLGALVTKLIKRCRSVTALPLLVGFGVSTAEDATAICQAGADGVIVGSRIVAEVPDCKRIADLTRQLRAGIVPLQ